MVSSASRPPLGSKHSRTGVSAPHFFQSATPMAIQPHLLPYTRAPHVHARGRGDAHMTENRLLRLLIVLRRRLAGFLLRRCFAGFPWCWPARPLGHPAMIEARQIIRRHYGSDHSFSFRVAAKILCTLAWPPAALINLLQIRR